MNLIVTATICFLVGFVGNTALGEFGVHGLERAVLAGIMCGVAVAILTPMIRSKGDK